jgi:chorismate-pyruvate lyase
MAEDAMTARLPAREPTRLARRPVTRTVRRSRWPVVADTVELESTGRIAQVDGVLWREIVVPGDGAGWVHAGYLTETAPALLEDDRRARSDRADREVTS